MGRTVSIFREKLLVLHGTPEDTATIKRSAPKFWELPDGEGIAVPWTYSDAAWLTAMGLPSVSPIFRDYQWSGPWSPMRHQMRIADFLVRHRRAYCLAGTGTGKTGAVTWASHYLLELRMIKRVLVLCPLSVLTDAWVPTINRLLFGKHTVTALVGDKAKRKKLVQQDTTFHVINFDGLETVHDELMANKYDLVVIDESTAIKNRSTKRWSLLKQIVDQAKYSWQLTGTPTPQGPLDAFGQLAMFDRFGGDNINKTWWESMTTLQVSKFKRVPKRGWQDTVARYMRPAIRIRTRDCIDLPERTDVRRYVPLTKFQEDAIKLLVKEELIVLDGKTVEAANRGILLNKMAQICAGAVYGADESVVEVKPTKRLEEVEYLIGQEEGKTIVFAPFKAAVKMITEHLVSKGFKAQSITGETSSRVRQEIFDTFQQPDKEQMEVLVAVPNAMSHGVTLTEGSAIIWYAPTTSNEIYEQANARIERNGQTRHMTITELWGHPREKELYDVIAGRAEGQLTLLDILNKMVRES